MATVELTKLTESTPDEHARLVGFDRDLVAEIYGIDALAALIKRINGDSGGGGGGGGGGTDGANGWSPVFRLIPNGSNVFVQITDWIGGTGDKPAIGYLTSTGVEAGTDNAVNVRGPAGTSTNGLNGNHGWTPTFTTQADGDRLVLWITDWTGGTDPKPATGYIGPAGIVSDIADASNIRGPIGLSGGNGWSPIFQVEGDGVRVLLRITSWIGGNGPIPATGYLGQTGVVASKDDALNIRGGTGGGGDPGASAWTPVYALIVDGSRRVLQITSWTGGSGDAPATGYLGATGVVADIADAVDIRGAAGTNTSGGGGEQLPEPKAGDSGYYVAVNEAGDGYELKGSPNLPQLRTDLDTAEADIAALKRTNPGTLSQAAADFLAIVREAHVAGADVHNNGASRVVRLDARGTTDAPGVATLSGEVEQAGQTTITKSHEATFDSLKLSGFSDNSAKIFGLKLHGLPSDSDLLSYLIPEHSSSPHHLFRITSDNKLIIGNPHPTSGGSNNDATVASSAGDVVLQSGDWIIASVSPTGSGVGLQFLVVIKRADGTTIQANDITFTGPESVSQFHPNALYLHTSPSDTAQSSNVETLVVIEHTGVAYYTHSRVAALDVSDDFFGFLSVGPGSDVLSFTKSVDFAAGSTMAGSDILTAADTLAVFSATGLPVNDGAMPYSVQPQPGHTAANMRGFVVVQIDDPGPAGGTYIVKVSDIGEGFANAYRFFEYSGGGGWDIYQENGTVKIDDYGSSGPIDSSANISAFYYLAAGKPSQNAPTIKLLGDTTTQSVTFTLAELAAHLTGSVAWCVSLAGNLATEGSGAIPMSVPVVALLGSDPTNLRTHGGDRMNWNRSTLTLSIKSGDPAGFEYLVIKS